MSLKQNINDMEVWREATIKFCLCWVVFIIITQTTYYLSDWYTTSHIKQMYMGLGVAFGNFIATFFKS